MSGPEAASATRPSRRQIITRVLLLIAIALIVFVGILPRVVDYDAVRAALSSLSTTQLAVLVVATVIAYVANTAPTRILIPALSWPRAIGADLAARAVVSTIPWSDRHRDTVRPLPPVGDPSRYGHGGDRLRCILRDAVDARPAGDRHDRGRRHGPRDPTGGDLADAHQRRRSDPGLRAPHGPRPIRVAGSSIRQLAAAGRDATLATLPTNPPSGIAQGVMDVRERSKDTLSRHGRAGFAAAVAARSPGSSSSRSRSGRSASPRTSCRRRSSWRQWRRSRWCRWSRSRQAPSAWPRSPISASSRRSPARA